MNQRGMFLYELLKSHFVKANSFKSTRHLLNQLKQWVHNRMKHASSMLDDKFHNVVSFYNHIDHVIISKRCMKTLFI
jgi:hypothetical protein